MILMTDDKQILFILWPQKVMGFSTMPAADFLNINQKGGGVFMAEIDHFIFFNPKFYLWVGLFLHIDYHKVLSLGRPNPSAK